MIIYLLQACRKGLGGTNSKNLIVNIIRLVWGGSIYEISKLL